MKSLLLSVFACLAIVSTVKAQSVALGVAGGRSFAAVEAPTWRSKAFHSPDWTLELNSLGATCIDGPKGLGMTLALEKRFFSLRVVGITLFSAYAHIGLGEVVFEQDRPRTAIVIGLTFR
jgi:hypothetical protein